MPRLDLFQENSIDKVTIKTDNEYAKNYDKWRKKEELNKLRTKYGEQFQDNSESSSSSDDEDEDVNTEFEKEFFKTLSYLKNKDPRIYDENTAFFKNVPETNPKTSKKEAAPMYLKDYERKIIIENEGLLTDEEQEDNGNNIRSLTYSEEQEQLKTELKTVLEEIEHEDKEKNEEWGGLFKKRHKTEEEKQKEEEDYKLWLAGQKEHLKDENVEQELKPLKDFWNNPNLDDSEKFLRDYILNKRFLDNEDKDYIPTYEEIIHDSDEGLSEDESAINKQEEFEHKYNFRFEEPDHEFIKCYPRIMENSLRKKDDKRKIKRQEVKERKKKEKQQKMEEIKQLKALKKKEIEEKMQMLKEITGNSDVGFSIEDIEGDFNPEEHDKRMETLFNNEFYSGPEGDQKPQFPDIDKEMDLEIENWDRWNGEENEGAEENFNEEYQPHCEDEDFNMDCEYDPTVAKQQALIDNTKPRKKRKRKSKFAEVVSEKKPVFDPKDKTFTQYLDEYYRLDCEDIIGDMPCRFKYREVIPNSFGLTTEEILLANDKELNRWCSLKKAVQIRPENVEKYDQIVYERKAKNEALKRKILPSLYADTHGSNEKVTTNSSTLSENSNAMVNKDEIRVKQDQSDGTNNANGKNKKKKSLGNEYLSEVKPKKIEAQEVEENVDNGKNNNKKRKRKHKHSTSSKKLEGQPVQSKKIKKSNDVHPVKGSKSQDSYVEMSDARLAAFGLNPKKFRNKMKYKNKKLLNQHRK